MLLCPALLFTALRPHPFPPSLFLCAILSLDAAGPGSSGSCRCLRCQAVPFFSLVTPRLLLLELRSSLCAVDACLVAVAWALPSQNLRLGAFSISTLQFLLGVLPLTPRPAQSRSEAAR